MALVKEYQYMKFKTAFFNILLEKLQIFSIKDKIYVMLCDIEKVFVFGFSHLITINIAIRLLKHKKFGFWFSSSYYY